MDSIIPVDFDTDDYLINMGLGAAFGYYIGPALVGDAYPPGQLAGMAMAASVLFTYMSVNKSTMNKERNRDASHTNDFIKGRIKK